MSFDRRPVDLPSDAVRLADEPLLLKYQQRLLSTTATHQVVVCEKSRRIGFTWGIGSDAVLTAAANKQAGGMDVFYIAYEREMTREFIDTCAAWARLFDKACSVVEEFVFKDRDADGNSKDILAFRIRFASGYDIVALSSSPRGLRGRQGYVIIDEAAFHDDLTEVIKAALALLMWGGKVLVISTHNGVDNRFNQMLEEARSGRRPYAIVRVTLDDAIADGLYRRICLVRGIAWTAEGETAWRQEIIDFYGDAADEELFCIPVQTGTSWIALPDIVAAEHDDAGDPAKTGRGAIYIGNDIARRSDRWVATALERVGDVLWLREESILRNARFAEHDAELDRMEADYRPVRFAMDQTGMGEKPVEDAKTRYGELRVEGVQMTSDRRLLIATVAKRAFQDGKIRIPRDPSLRHDLQKIKMIAAATGAPRLVAGRDKTGHADRAWALFLAIAAADVPAAIMDFDIVATRRTAGWRGDGGMFDDGTRPPRGYL